MDFLYRQKKCNLVNILYKQHPFTAMTHTATEHSLAFVVTDLVTSSRSPNEYAQHILFKYAQTVHFEQTRKETLSTVIVFSAE